MIKNNLKKLRGDGKQGDVAAALGMSQGVYSMVESGRSVLTQEELNKVAEYFGIAPESIYPPAINEAVYGFGSAEKTAKPKTTVSVKLPAGLMEWVDRLVERGEYLNRSDYISTVLRKDLEVINRGEDV